MKINLITFNKYAKVNPHNSIYQTRNGGGMINPFARDEKDRVEISFKAGDHCTTQDFKIKEIPNLHCPVCGLVMLNDDQIGFFVNDVAPRKGQELVDALERYEDASFLTSKPTRSKNHSGIYRPIKKQIVDIYKILALENPQLNLLELTKLQASICISALITQQMEIIDELVQYIEANFEDDQKEALLKKVDKYVKQIKGEDKETFARKKFIFAMKNSFNSSHRENVLEILDKLPTSENDINSFFVKYAKAAPDSREIAKKFVNQSIPTADHIKPRALGGKDSLSNYICDCADCNAKRGHTPFSEWLQSLPDFEDRLQEYLEDVRIAIDSELYDLDPSYDTYIDKVIETIDELTEGEVILIAPEATNPKKNAAVIARRKNEVERFRLRNSELIETRKSLQAQIEKLEAYKDFEEIDEYREAIAQITQVNPQLENLNQELSELRLLQSTLKTELTALTNKIKTQKVPELKLALQEQRAQKEQEYKERESKIASLEKRIGILKRKRINHKRQKRSFTIKQQRLQEEINATRTILTKINTLNEKISKLGNYKEKEINFREKITNIQRQLKKLQTQNQIIEQKENFNTSDTSSYNLYTRLLEVLRTAENMLNSKEYKKVLMQVMQEKSSKGAKNQSKKK